MQGWVMIPWQTIWDCQGKQFPINIYLSFNVGIASNYDICCNFFLYFRMRKYWFSLLKNKIVYMWAFVFHANLFNNNTCGSIKLTVRISVLMYYGLYFIIVLSLLLTFKFVWNHLLYSTKFAKVYVRDPMNRTVYEINLFAQNE